MATLIRFFVGS